MAKFKITVFLEYLFVIVMVLNCRSVYTSIGVKGFGYAMLLLLLVAVGTYVFVKPKVDKGKLFSVTIFTAFILIYLSLYLFMTRIGVNDVAQLTVALIFIYAFYTLYCDESLLNDLLGKYVNVIVIITLVSLVFWVFASNLNIISPSEINYSSWGNGYVRNYHFVYFETQSDTSLMTLLGLAGYRNTAIFNEAPMYSFHLTMALLIQCFLRKDYDRMKLVVIILGIVTSFSTTGYVAMAGTLLAKYLIQRGSNKSTKVFKWLLIPMLAYIVINIIIILFADKLEDGSGKVRADDVEAWLALWKHNIIFGAGYGTREYIRYIAAWRFGSGASNSVVFILGYGGLWLMALYFIPCLLGLVRSFRYKNLDAVAFIVLFLFVFSITIVPFQYITFFIFSMMKDGFKGSKSYKIEESIPRQISGVRLET